MNSSQYIFLDIQVVQRVILEKDKQDSYRIDELSVAVFLCRFCEKIWKTECAIGFPLKNSHADSVPFVGSSNLKELKDILNAKTEQDHDVDVVIVEHTSKNPKRAGQGFQIKRFGINQGDLTTSGLLRFIQNLNLKYAKTETALVILLETGGPIKFTEIRNLLDFNIFPFSSLFFVGLYGDTLKLVEVWPNLGKEELLWNLV